MVCYLQVELQSGEWIYCLESEFTRLVHSHVMRWDLWAHNWGWMCLIAYAPRCAHIWARDQDSPHNRCVVSHGNPEKMFPSNVLISLEAEKNPLSLIENPHKSPFRNFFYDHSKVELFSFLCSNFYKKILSITRQRKDATAVAQLTLILNARVSYHKCHTHK